MLHLGRQKVGFGTVVKVAVGDVGYGCHLLCPAAFEREVCR